MDIKSLFGMSNKAYDRLRFLTTILIPALATAYVGLGQIWDFPNTAEVAESSVVVVAFLGAVLGISRKQYENSPKNHIYDGDLIVDPADPEEGTFVAVNAEPGELVGKQEITLQVKKINPSQ